MLHRYRSAMVRPGLELLAGRVEIDETFIGGVHPGVRDRCALGKTLVAIEIELNEPRGFGRARMSIIAAADTKTLRTFLTNTVQTRIHRGHRRAGLLPHGLQRLIHPRTAPGLRLRTARKRATACRASGRIFGYAVDAGHSPRPC